MKAQVYVTLKREVLDPQGDAVKRALSSMGFEEVKSTRIGKFIEIDLDGDNKDKAEKRLKSMSEKLLCNPVIEDFRVEIVES